jgi:surface carbohydrate biosynthesis protein (TIGR04326 family)
MKLLLIIDGDIDCQKINVQLDKSITQIDLFPLTGNFVILEKIRTQLAVTTVIIDSATLINNEVEIMQKTIHNWSHDLGNLPVNNKKLKDWFTLPDGGGTAWWFGMIAEKNSVQDGAYFTIAQCNALQTHCKSSHYAACWIALSNKRQAKIIKQIAHDSIRQCLLFSSVPAISKSLKRKIFDSISHLGMLGAFIMSSIYWLVWIKDSRLARKNLAPLDQRISTEQPFLFISYFPNIDEAAAKDGIFRNKYAVPLQEKMAELKLPHSWLVMPVYYNGHNFASSMQLIKKFSANGEKIFVLQEFFTPKVLAKAFGWWLRLCWLSMRLALQIDKQQLTAQLTHPACLPLIKYLWWQSFVGAAGTRGIIFYLTYLEMFKQLKQVKTCLYYCEMQAWEKAMLLAKKKQNPAVKAFAFQHTVIMKNYFNYFYHNEEISQTGSHTDFPLPDKLLANGTLMYDLLALSGFPNLHEAEAVRQLYISQRARITDALPSVPVLLVVGSYDRVETRSLITMVYKAFPKAENLQIWFKGSPVNPVDILFAELGIHWQAANYQILTRDVAELLQLTTIALVANTTVAIEAIAFGKPLIIPLFADTMLMNPVIDTKAEYHQVTNPQQLQEQVTLLLAQTDPNNAPNAEFINSYWHLDPDMPRWTQLLTMELCKETI